MPVMIQYNYATEICMTRGQEGFVHGWQSKRGLNGQLVINTLFVRLKDPPTHVEVLGLPENVVLVYPMTTNIDTMLPNDEKLHITHTQVEVLAVWSSLQVSFYYLKYIFTTYSCLFIA